MSLVIENAGILTTVQDLGRYGSQKFGITTGGAMDPWGVRLVNILLGNYENEGALEMHFPASRIRFEAPALCAVAGGDFAAALDRMAVENWQLFPVNEGSVLSFSKKRSGSRCYLGTRGGFAIEPWMGSQSTNLAAGCGGYNGRKLKTGDRLSFRSPEANPVSGPNSRISHSLIPPYSNFPTVRVTPGAEFDELSADGRNQFLHNSYKITGNSDRMGYRLLGESISLLKPREMISSAVTVGTIQLLPDGQLIILMADHQTTGGYPRLAHVITHDLPLLAQIGPGDQVAFQLTDINTAEELMIEAERNLSFLRVACRLQSNC